MKKLGKLEKLPLIPKMLAQLVPYLIIRISRKTPRFN